MMAYTGRLCPKGVGISRVEAYERLGNLPFIKYFKDL